MFTQRGCHYRIVCRENNVRLCLIRELVCFRNSWSLVSIVELGLSHKGSSVSSCHAWYMDWQLRLCFGVVLKRTLLVIPWWSCSFKEEESRFPHYIHTYLSRLSPIRVGTKRETHALVGNKYTHVFFFTATISFASPSHHTFILVLTSFVVQQKYLQIKPSSIVSKEV